MDSEYKTVGQLSERLALACGYNRAEAEIIGWAAEFHDIGKSLIPPSIIHKPGKLLPGEFETMKLHTKYGEKILHSIPGDRGLVARQIALLHHEWYNGKGYWGYKASVLPMFINMVSLCDVFVALANKRAYKDKWPYADIVDYIHKQAGTQFDPRLIDPLISIMSER
jgi:HD-GYP domain-containing protein (c-di-GMP phosphodiesterase class II)